MENKDDHHRKDDEKIDLMYRVIFGDEITKEKGMVYKVDEMYTIITQSRTIRDFFGGFKAPVAWLLLIGGAIVVFKKWAALLITWILTK